MVDYWARTHLARMRARRPHSQDSDGSMILHFAIDTVAYRCLWSALPNHRQPIMIEFGACSPLMNRERIAMRLDRQR